MTAEGRTGLVSITLLIAFTLALVAGRAHATGQQDEHTVFLRSWWRDLRRRWT